jgi:hypothetical protein
MPTIDPMLDPDEKFSINKFPGNGSTVTWNLNFSGGYIRREHVKAYRQTASGVQTEVTLVWTGPNTVTVTPAVPSGSTLVVYRDTPKSEPLTNFSDGAIINEANLDLLAKQSIFVAAEMVDRFADVALEAGVASELAIETASLVSQAVEDAAAAVAAAGTAEALSTSVAAQFNALLATVQDLSGVDLAGIPRLDAAQTFTQQQTFPSIRLVASGQELELFSTGSFRMRPSGGSWTDRVLNAWDSITDKPTTFAPTSHTHPWDAIFNKPTQFAPTAHTHAWSEVTGKPTEFNPVSHTHSWSSVTGKPDVAVQGQSVNFSAVSIAGTRVVAITASSAEPTGGQDGDIHFVL